MSRQALRYMVVFLLGICCGLLVGCGPKRSLCYDGLGIAEDEGMGWQAAIDRVCPPPNVVEWEQYDYVNNKVVVGCQCYRPPGERDRFTVEVIEP